MRGNSQERPRFFAAKAFIAGAAFLAGATTPSFATAQVSEPTEDTAMAIPRLSLPGGAPAFPRPLPPELARIIREAFANPARGLDDLPGTALATSLAGHILADRFLAPRATVTADALQDWLARYPTLPDAPAIHAALLTRLPKTAQPPAAPTLAGFTLPPPGDDIETADRLLPRNPALDRTVRDAARAGQFDRALHVLSRTPGLSVEYGAILRAEIARAMFSQGHDLDALALAETADAKARGATGLPAWVAGLAAWRLGRFETARTWFESAWRARLIAPGQKAAAAYWAGRANLMTHGEYGPWMHRAAQNPRTFYGLLARRVMGQPIEPAATPYDKDLLSPADIDALAATTRGERAFALMQVGQNDRAMAELRLLYAEKRDLPGFGRSILLTARLAGMQDLASQISAVMQPAAVRLPATELRPAGGFRFDPALVYALIRMESNFDAGAISPAGARGLMQLMPVTAQYVAPDPTTPPRLHDPATNLLIGQRYVLYLTRLEAVGTDLIRVLAAYNAGPGNFARWIDAMQQEHDPLLFIEALPGEETRAYVPRALAYTWLYAAQMHLPSPSLDALSAGLWPRLELRPARRDPAVQLH